MKRATGELAQGVLAIGLAIAVFFALTMSVQFWLATSSHDSATRSLVVMPHPTPDPGTSAP